MVIPIHIPIGVKRVASVQGKFWRIVRCAHCQEPFGILLELEATGISHDVLFVGGQASVEAARLKAVENLQAKSENVVLPVPCPSCGSYQEDMAQKLKDDAAINPLQIVGGIMVLLSLIPLAFSTGSVAVAITVVMGLAGLGILVRGIVRSQCFDPNAGDPEPRKALGRKQVLWGEPLVEHLANELSREKGTGSEGAAAGPS